MRLLILLIFSLISITYTTDTNICHILETQTKNKPCQCLQVGAVTPDRGSNLPRAIVGCNRGTMPQILRAIRVFPKGTHLEKLWLWDNVLPLVPRSFFQNVSTNTLVLETSEVGAFLPGSLQALGVQLEELELRNNALDRVGSGMLANLPGLKRLCLSGNRIGTVGPPDFAGLSTLRHLSLQRNNLTRINPRTFGDLSSLALLDLSNNQLSMITKDTFIGLSNLESLTLAHNAINEIETGAFDPLVNLKILDLSSNRLTAFTGTAAKLPSLQKLFLSDNTISDVTVVDTSGQRLPSLRILHLDKNKISTVPNYSFRAAGTQLSTLSVTNNEISAIEPRAFEGLSGLQTLSLQQNIISDLPDSIFEPLTRLQRLFLSHNRIGTLENDSLVGLNMLQTLNLGHNELETMDIGVFTGMLRLEKLYINDNNIASIDNATFSQLPRTLNAIDISGNPWRCSCVDTWMANWFASYTAPGLGIPPDTKLHLPNPTFLQPKRTLCHSGHPITDAAMYIPEQTQHQQHKQKDHKHQTSHEYSTSKDGQTDRQTDSESTSPTYIGSQVTQCSGAGDNVESWLPDVSDVSITPAIKTSTSAYITSLAMILGALSVAIIFGIGLLFYRDQIATKKQLGATPFDLDLISRFGRPAEQRPQNSVVPTAQAGPSGPRLLSYPLRLPSATNIPSILTRSTGGPKRASSCERPLTQATPKKSVTIRLPHDMVQLLPSESSTSSSLNQF